MQKTPDEIKKGLECCMDYQNCTEGEDPQCPYYDAQRCMEALLADALALIQQLQAENAEKDARIHQLEAERDAAVKALKDFGGCMACKSANVLKRDSPCKECILDGQVTRDYWIWRGVQKEDTP